MAAQIPSRATSKYAGQYGGAFDSQRIVDIFVDSYKIAMSSKIPQTASDRFALAVAAYHQLMSMGLTTDVQESVNRSMETLVGSFPIQVVANEALGLRDKALRLKTPRKRLDLLLRAREILNRGLTEHPSSLVLQESVAELRTVISQAEVPDTLPVR